MPKITPLKKIYFLLFSCFFFLGLQTLFAQSPKKIIIEYSDYADVNQTEIPDAFLLTGNVRVNHDGAILTCNKAYYFQKENYLKAFGNVQMTQGDTLSLNSKYAEYNGNSKEAYATGNVVMRSPESILTTDTVYFDKKNQEAFYNTYGTIRNKENTLRSKSGRYYVDQKKYKFEVADVKQYLQTLTPNTFDLVVMDPPTFSNSKKMKDFLDIQQDHVELLNQTLKAMKPGAVLYFSNNARKFELYEAEIQASSIKDITKATTPFDYEGKLQRWCWRMVK